MRKEIYEKNGNQESSDILPFHWEFGKEEITLKVSSYAYGNGLVVLMYSQSEGELELFGDLTVNLPGGYGLEPQEAFVSGEEAIGCDAGKQGQTLCGEHNPEDGTSGANTSFSGGRMEKKVCGTSRTGSYGL